MPNNTGTRDAVPVETATGPLVVFHTTYSWLPQTQTWLYNQVRCLPEEIFNHIVVEQTENLDQFELPRIHSLRAASRLRFYWEKGLRRAGVRPHLQFLADQMRSHMGQLLHSHFGPVGWANSALAQRLGVKHVVTFYGQDVHFFAKRDPRWHARYREMFARVDAVLCEGPHMAQEIIALGCPPGKVHVHHLGVRVDALDFAPRRWTPGEPLRVLMAATFREKKGFPDAILALGALRDSVPLEVTIIGDAGGDAASQAEKVRILTALETSGLRAQTRLLGFRPHSVFFEEAYRHHLFLSPSLTASDGDTEGGAPVTLIELAGTGMPIVSTRHADIPNVILHGETGRLAGERDVPGLVTELRWWLEHPTAWETLLQAGRKRVETEFSAAVQGERLAVFYRRLARG